MTANPILSLLPRPIDGHKGTFGTVLAIGGSRGMSGSISMTGSAALRSGCGLVRLAVPEVCLETVAVLDRCYTTIPLPCDSSGKIAYSALPIIVEEAKKATAIAIGPGLSRSVDLTRLVAELYQQIDKPMIVDADALNALSESGILLENARPAPGPRILTPHPGEFRRLFSRQNGDLSQQRDGIVKPTREEQTNQADLLARQTDVVVALKGHRTHVTNGETVYVNETGNSGMATGGSGDVLTGIAASLAAQNYPVYKAACVAVWIHGLAGDCAAERLGAWSVTAEAILDSLPEAFCKASYSNGRQYTAFT